MIPGLGLESFSKNFSRDVQDLSANSDPFPSFFSTCRELLAVLFREKCSEMSRRRKLMKAKTQREESVFAHTSCRSSPSSIKIFGIELGNRVLLSKAVDLLVEYISRCSDVIHELFLSLLTGSRTTTRRLGVLGASSSCHSRHCAPTARHALSQPQLAPLSGRRTTDCI